jgi:hypothetical protein
MFTVPCIAALFLFVYFRPHEIFEALKPLTFNVIAGLLVWGYAMDLRTGFVRPRGTPLLWLGTTFLVFCVFSHAVKASTTLGVAIPLLGASLFVFVLVSQGLPNFNAVEAVAAVLLTITLIIASIGVYQAMSPLTCFAWSTEKGASASDGRPCSNPTNPEECYRGGAPDTTWQCEHAGVFDTSSIQGRVRYRGILQDPNELAWAVCMGAPLAFALYGRKRSAWRLLVLVAMLLLGAVCVIKTQSRSGQLTFAAMLGVYFVRRYKWGGLIIALVAAAPVMLLGGRSDERAAGSTEERIECWKEGFSMWKTDYFLGVGHGQFTEHHYLTAHSSLVLSLAELGPIGFFLFTAVIYLAFKIALRAQIQYAGAAHAAVAQPWSMAVLASLTGTLVSAFFLSIPYHPIVWIDLGLVGALYVAIRNHDPTFEVRFGWMDAAIVFVADIAIIVAFKVFLAYH